MTIAQTTWQSVFSALLGLIVGVASTAFVAGRSAVTRSDMQGLIYQYSPYTQDAKVIRVQLDSQSQQIGALQRQISDLSTDVARISEKLDVRTEDSYNRGPRR